MPEGGEAATHLRPSRALAPAVMLAMVSAWLWPIGIGGKMPVGGDVTQFTLGLMAELSRSLNAGRLPLWNDLWGFGFPGLAESQMGVYYPPHALLYRFLSVEAAYTASLVLHTYWAALGAFWAARRFGVSPWGACLSGYCWSCSGIYLIHLSHQWGYTTGSWMPWALGLGASITFGRSRAWMIPLLAAVLGLQILPGHFQFAFETQVLLIGMAAWNLVARPGGTPKAVRSSIAILSAIAAVVPLTAMQLWPTWRLAKLADSHRDFAYLSAFPASPVHLVNLVAPDLFHLSPLWRPVAWDPFHAMPEEHRPYIGLIPLLLALGAIRRGVRRDPVTSLLVVLALGSLLLSLGPYVPGFWLLIRLPGFSFFRAPSRWGLAMTLSLAILAGRGLDSWRSWPHVGFGAVRFVAVAAILTGLVVGLVELAFRCTEGAGIPAVADVFGKAVTWLPWSGDPPFRSVMASSRRGPTDPLILGAMMHEGIDPRRAVGMRLDRERFTIYARELVGLAAMLLAVLAAAPMMSRRMRGANAVLILLTFFDLMLLSRHRPVRTAPIRSLTEQSAVLGALAELPRGSRTSDVLLGNLPMVAGAAPVSAYRTLDRPVLSALTRVAATPKGGAVDAGTIDRARRAVGASVGVLSPFDPPEGRAQVDPGLADWLYGDWADRAPSARTFHLWMAESATRAWFVPGAVAETSDPGRVLEVLDRATPARFVPGSPGQFTVEVDAPRAGTLIVSVLDDPEWIIDGVTRPFRVFGTPGGGAWQAISIDRAGPRRLVWTYRGEAVRLGQWISLGAWLTWAGVMAWTLRRPSP